MIGKINHIRYADLDRLLSGKFNKDDKVNLFINLEPLVRPLLGKNFAKYLQVRKDDRIKELIADILNIAAHYRKFLSNNGIYSKVYMYITSLDNSKYYNQVINREYRSTFYNRFNQPDAIGVKELINEAIRLATIITNYIDGVYIIKSEIIEPSIIPQHISRNGWKNVLVTSDIYEYQYAANDNFILLKPNLDLSQVITSENVIERIKVHEKVVNDISFPSTFAPLILSGINDKYRDIRMPKGFGATKWIKTLNNLVENNHISSTDPKPFNLSYLPESVIDTDIGNLIVDNFKMVDVVSQEKTIKVDKLVEGLLIDKFDNVSLKELTSIFTDYPINLIEIQDFEVTNKRQLKWE